MIPAGGFMTDKPLDTVAAKWWVMLLRGVFAIALGITALARPGLTLIICLVSMIELTPWVEGSGFSTFSTGTAAYFA
jgi:hypothetical protein